MKYCKLLNTITINSSRYYLNYKRCKKHIYYSNFLTILEEEINTLENKYNYQDFSNYMELYSYLITNYITIQKIIKKWKKKNTNSNHALSINDFLSKYKFYQHIIKLPILDSEKNKNHQCPICLEDGIFPITTNCNHTFCWSCMTKCSSYMDICPYCKQECILDPTLIYIDQILDNNHDNSKYGLLSNNISNNISIDIISDLHIDQWDTNIMSKYPHGSKKTHPFIIDNYPQSNILVVAGDISDNLQLSLDYLNEISKYYQSILFVDGNHEHVELYPKLYNSNTIAHLVKKYNNPKLYYLTQQDFRFNNTIFIGCCGWWDYNNNNPIDISNNLHYFDQWIPEFTQEENQTFIDEVTLIAKQEYQQLENRIKEIEKDETIDNIIIVSHTIPKSIFVEKTHSISNEMNTPMEKLLLQYPKIKKWIFGHTHQSHNTSNDGIQYMCNPRGRPDDFNRLEYRPITIKI